MRLPFFDRFITKNKHFVDMEEIIDKMLREMMRRPGEDYLQIADSINASEQHAENAMEQIQLNAPVFYRTMQLVGQEPDDTVIAGETVIILPYIAQLREIMGRQKLDDEEDDI